MEDNKIKQIIYDAIANDNNYLSKAERLASDYEYGDGDMYCHDEYFCDGVEWCLYIISHLDI